MVRDDDPEKDLSGIQNIQRGIFYENEGVQYFERQSGSTAGQVGFFIHPNVPNFGASPDAVCASGILLEVKTRGIGADGPLVSLKDFPNYFAQCQLQMACTGAHSCILLSYHPETKKGNFFLVVRDSYLTGVMLEVVGAMVKGQMLKVWSHKEPKRLAKIGEHLIHKNIDFDNLKSFRAYIKSLCKNISTVTFYDIDFLNN